MCPNEIVALDVEMAEMRGNKEPVSSPKLVNNPSGLLLTSLQTLQVLRGDECKKSNFQK